MIDNREFAVAPAATQKVDTQAERGPIRRAPLSHREAKWLLALGDIASLAIPFVFSVAHQSALQAKFGTGDVALTILAIIAALGLASSLDLYDIGLAASYKKTQRATLCAIVLVLIARPLFEDPSAREYFEHNRYALYAIAAVAGWRMAFAFLARSLPISRRILVVGAGVAGSVIAEQATEREQRGEQGFALVGFVDDDETKIKTQHYGYPVLGSSKEVRELIREHNVDTIALAVNRVPVLSADIFQALLDAREAGATFVSMPAPYEDLARKVALTHVGHNWGITFPVEHYHSPLVHDLTARCIDIVSGIFGCIVAGMVAPVVAIVNKIQSPGPLLYSQLRVGKGGKLFRIYKFRSMVVDAEKHGAVWCTEGDPRITKFGNFLRKTRVDELPQFWNVLKGEMSLIGPRPERPEFVDILATSIPFFRARHAVKPGITGWAQVMYHYGASEEDSLEKLQYDLYYVKRRSVGLDLLIIAKSIRTILTAAGR